MWSTVALAAALSLGPAQPPAIQLTNVRLTVGELGPPRPTNKVLPGDIVFVGFDIEGLTIEPDGTAKYTMAMEVLNASGKSLFKQNPSDVTDFAPLRGNKLPARAFVTVGADQPAAVYTCRLTVTDPKTKATNALSVQFEVLKPDFGIIGVVPTHDAQGKVFAPTTGLVGQILFVNFSVTGFQRDPKTKQPNVELEFNILDEKGQPTLGQPAKRIQDTGVDEKHPAFMTQFILPMSRPGKFTVRITATDKVGNKKAVYDLPVTVLPAQ